MTTRSPPSRDDYNVAWICALDDPELDAARAMLDCEYDRPDDDTQFDDNTYVYGILYGHRVVVACLPAGQIGNVNASHLTSPLFRVFPHIKIVLLVGIGGGVPRDRISEDALKNLHLGDVVVGWPGDGSSAVIYYDLGKITADGEFEVRGQVRDPDFFITQALTKVHSDHRLEKAEFGKHVERLGRRFAMPETASDQLFEAGYDHEKNENTCKSCAHSKLVQRPQRTDAERKLFVFHGGRIATGNSVVKSGVVRERINKRCGGVLCIEMEAAGVNIGKSCLVIRGISDYADSHKNDKWKHRAAGNAAAFARELLRTMSPGRVKGLNGNVSNAEHAVSAQNSLFDEPSATSSISDGTAAYRLEPAPEYHQIEWPNPNPAHVSILRDLQRMLDKWLSESSSSWNRLVRAPNEKEYSVQHYRVAFRLATRAMEARLPFIYSIASKNNQITLGAMCTAMAKQLSFFLHSPINQQQKGCWEVGLLERCLQQIERPVFGLIHGFNFIRSEGEEYTDGFFRVLREHAERQRRTRILFMTSRADERLKTYLATEWHQRSALEEVPVGNLYFRDV